MFGLVALKSIEFMALNYSDSISEVIPGSVALELGVFQKLT